MPITIPVDFTGVEARESVRVPEGDYVAKIVKVKKGESSQKKTPGLFVTFELQGGDFAGKRISDRHWLTQDSLWTLRNMLEAIGYQVPSGPMKLQEKMLVGKKVGLTIIDGEEYKGRIRSEIADYLAAKAVGNIVRSDEADALSDDDEDDDGLGFGDSDDEPEDDEGFGLDDDDEEEAESESDEDEEEDESFGFDDEEEETEEEEVSLSFTPKDIDDAKAPELKAYVKEAQDAGWDLGLGKKPKVAEVKEALHALFADDEEEDDEADEFSLDDLD